MLKSSYNHNLNFEIYGQSHDEEIGIIINNIPSGYLIDFNEINEQLILRQGEQEFNTARQDKLKYDIKSGFSAINDDNHGITSGEAINIVFLNEDVKPKDYENILQQPRPGHIDYVAKMKYGENHTIAGGGHFSGRLTLPLVFLGNICKQILFDHFPTMDIISHINYFQDYKDISYYELRKFLINKLVTKDLTTYNQIHLQLLATKINDNLHKILLNGITDYKFPTFNKETGQKMQDKASKLADDTAGGQIETIIINPPSFIGDPWFYSVESIISSFMYSIPSIKAIEFGNSESFMKDKGSQTKDEIIYLDNKRLTTLYNNNGGINGGISNGEDIVFNTIIKPISSIQQEQKTYNIIEKKITPVIIKGRHDKTIINRIIPIINAMTYIAIYDMVLKKK